MGLFTTALAFGAGYTLGKPGGREQAMIYLQQARDQAREQARNPKADRVLDRGRRLVADQLRAAAQRVDAGGGGGGAPPTAAPPQVAGPSTTASGTAPQP